MTARLTDWVRPLAALACVGFLGAGVATPCAAAGRVFTVDDLARLRTVSEVQLSPDGSKLLYVERSVDAPANKNHSRIWIVTLADGSKKALTPDTAEDATPRWSPDGMSVASLSSDAGKPAVIVTRLDTGARRVLAHYETSSDPLAYQGIGEPIAWSPDGKTLAYLSADPGPEPGGSDPYVITRLNYKSWTGINDNRRWHIRLASLADGKSTQLTKGIYQEHSLTWSPNGEEIAFVSNHEPDPDRVHNYDIFAVKISNGQVRQITKTPGTEYMPKWSPDGQSILCIAGVRALTTRESNAEDTHPWVFPAAGGEGKALAPSLDRRASSPTWAPDGTSVWFVIEDHGSRPLYRVGLTGQAPEMIVPGPGNVSGFAVSKNGTLAYEMATPKAPADIFVKTVASAASTGAASTGVAAGTGASASAPATQITTLNAWLKDRDVSPAEAFEFASFDKTTVQGFFTPPLDRAAGGRHPVILMIHGGPHGQQGPAFNLKSQVYAGQGYAVVMINYRGSTGYGQTFSDGTRNDQNGGEGKDVLAGIEAALARDPSLDPDRMGVEGGSYGGQLTNWVITQTTRFKAAIPAASISNLVSMAYTHWAADYMQSEYGGYPWERDIAARLWEHSALAHVAKVTTPTMFVHGELDQDVSVTEPEQFYNALRQRGIEAIFLRYPREGHGLREPGHVADALRRSLEFYARLVKGGPARPSSSAGGEP